MMVFVCNDHIAKAAETVNSTQIRIENNSAQKDYQEQEEGKVLPFRWDMSSYSISRVHPLTCFHLYPIFWLIFFLGGMCDPPPSLLKCLAASLKTLLFLPRV